MSNSKLTVTHKDILEYMEVHDVSIREARNLIKVSKINTAILEIEDEDLRDILLAILKLLK